MFSCGWKTDCACIRNCQCKNAGLKWINMCSGAVGEPAIIVTLMMMSSEHNRFSCITCTKCISFVGLLTVSPNLISISVPSLLYHGVVFITITLLCIYVKMLRSWQSSHGRAWSVIFGNGIQSNWYGQHVRFISMHLITIWLMKWLSLILGMAIWCF